MLLLTSQGIFYLLLIGLILCLCIAILRLGDDRLISMIHFDLTIGSTCLVLNRAQLEIVHGLLEVQHRSLVLFKVDNEIIGALALEDPSAEVLDIEGAGWCLLVDQAVDELQLCLDFSLLILQVPELEVLR